ncbi:MAG: hypothetical protein ACNS62_12205, partial [Candidatus Cyclobacteriaceae bacterium M3_2C_046]
MDRRRFIEQATLSTVATGLFPLQTFGNNADNRYTKLPFSGIQIAAHSFYDEGMDYCLDLQQE